MMVLEEWLHQKHFQKQLNSRNRNMDEMPRVFVDLVPSLDGGYEKRVVKVGDGSIIKLFDRTKPPEKDKDVVCPHFLELKWANGCFFNCSWCYLQGTFRFLERGKRPFIKDWNKIFLHLNALFKYNSRIELLNAGELSDSLVGEYEEPPASKKLIELFSTQRNYRLLFVTKSDKIANLLEMKPENVIVSFSINALPVAERWEKGAPNPIRRIQAANELYDHGYPVRIRIDPIVPVKKWKIHYQDLIRIIFNNLEPERITLGTLRGLATTIRCAKDTSWVNYLEEKTSWGLKPRFDVRYEIYQSLIETLEKEFGYKAVSLCKETAGMWKSLEMDYIKIKCNCLL